MSTGANTSKEFTDKWLKNVHPIHVLPSVQMKSLVAIRGMHILATVKTQNLSNQNCCLTGMCTESF